MNIIPAISPSIFPGAFQIALTMKLPGLIQDFGDEEHTDLKKASERKAFSFIT